MRFFKTRQEKKVLSLLRQWQIECDQCGGRLSIEGLEPLGLAPCPHCNIPVFIPGFVAGYWLFLPLGGGGQGRVYKAVHATNEQCYAVKLLHHDYKDDPNAVAVFETEWQIMQDIGPHYNIVSLIDAGISEGEYYYVMNFLDCDRLDACVPDGQGVPEVSAARILLGLLAAEKHIYYGGYLYRDIKSQNVFVQRDGNSVLVDFGLCLPLDQAALPLPEGETEIEGSAFFMPPERLVGAPEGPESEIYSLGMLLFYILSGQNYYKTSDRMPNVTDPIAHLSQKHVKGPRLTVTQGRLPQCHRPIIDLVNRMIAREPADRIQTFDEVEAVLMPLLPDK